MTVLRRKSRNESAHFVALIDLCFVGAFIAGVYELRHIANANCSSFELNSNFSVTLGFNGIDTTGNGDLFSGDVDKTCAMLKASFAFGIVNTIFFFFTAFLLLFMRKESKDGRRSDGKREVYSSRRRSHDSRYVEEGLEGKETTGIFFLRP